MSTMTGRRVVLRPLEGDDLPALGRIPNHPAHWLPLSSADMNRILEEWRG